MTSSLRVMLLALFVGAASIAAAKSFSSGSLSVEDAWGRATAAGTRVGVGYMTVKNAGNAPVKLVGGSTPVAERVEIHSMTMDNGVMRMRPVTGGLTVPAKGRVALGPGGYHLMLIGLKRALAEGEVVPLRLTFDQGGPIDVGLSIKQAGGGEHGNH